MQRYDWRDTERLLVGARGTIKRHALETGGAGSIGSKCATEHKSAPASNTFDLDLTRILPRLHAYAMSLTRNADSAQDLVQQTVMKALAARDSFQAGSNFTGWLFRIQRNEFFSQIRRTRRAVQIYGDVEAVPDPPRQESGLMLRDFVRAFRQLSRGELDAMLLSQLEGWTSRQIADRSVGLAAGTVKSRVSRGRAKLARLLKLADPTPIGARPHKADRYI
jgi:RNA polymerase sigma-70 factor (ECF subfamily)